MNDITKKLIDQLRKETNIYKDFIIKHHGQSTLDRLNLELAIQKTNEVLEANDMTEFEARRKN